MEIDLIYSMTNERNYKLEIKFLNEHYTTRYNFISTAATFN